MLGWRAKLGVIVPSCNTVLEPEFYALLPTGVTAHFARVSFPPNAAEDARGVSNMLSELPQALANLADARLDAIAFGCTAGSFLDGTRGADGIVDMIARHTGAAGTTTVTAVVDALTALGITKLTVVTPYMGWLAQRLEAFLSSSGLQVVSMRNLGQPDAHLDAHIVADMSPQNTYRLVREADVSGADGVFISCTDYRTIEILDCLERDLGKPVVSSNQATFWKLLQLSGVKERMTGFGALLTL
jgi:maleate cis-trans isomerase